MRFSLLAVSYTHLTFKFDGTSTVGAWQGAATATSPDLKYEYKGSFTVIPQEADKEIQTNLEETGKALFMLMPQDASAVKLTISYSAVNGEQKGFSGDKDVTLTGTWTMGHSIRYILKLTSDTTPVTFGQPTSVEWIPENPQPDEIPTPAKQ